MARIYYNEYDPYAAQWLRNLMADGHIPSGDVDERSIVDVKPDDLKGYHQCHWFAGIGGWPLALRLAGWPDERPVWTASLPCQPFSQAGKQLGTADERHLWPVFRVLLEEWGVPVVLGEQVASKAGRDWLSGVRADLEDMDYDVGAADLCAASAGEAVRWRVDYEDGRFEWMDGIISAPHIRQRLFWCATQRLADDDDERWRQLAQCHGGSLGGGAVQQRAHLDRRGDVRGMADADGRLARDGDLQPGRQHGQQQEDGRSRSKTRRLGDTEEQRRDGPRHTGTTSREESGGARSVRPEDAGPSGGLGDASGEGSGRDARTIPGAQGEGAGERSGAGRVGDQPVDASPTGGMGDADRTRSQGRLDGSGSGRRADQRPARSSGIIGAWSAYDIVHCTDGKARRFESFSQPVVDGISGGLGRLRTREDVFPLAVGARNRVGRLRAYGNAIVSPLAAIFIEEVLSLLDNDVTMAIQPTR